MKGFVAFTSALAAGLVSADATLLTQQAWRIHPVVDACPSTPLLTNPACQRWPPPPAASHAPPVAQAPPQNITSHPYEWRGGTPCIGPYCLYHNRGYAHSRGIVLLTTAPALAHLKHTLAAAPPPAPLPESLFAAVDMPGKGVGLVAQAPIPAGTPLIASPPVLLVHRAFFERPPADAAVLYDQIPALLPAAARRALLRQMGGSVRGIVATNAFQVDVGGDVAGGHHHHFGVFPAISRLNHDCGPNAAAWTDKTGLVHRAFASKDIAAGEEISISYVDALAPRAERRARMAGSWGFECGCRRCAAGDESDARVAEIKALEARLGDVAAKVTMGDIERYLELMKEEGLEGKMAGAYTTAALNYSLFGKQSLAVRHARLALECGLREEGPHAADVAAMRELAKAPKEHFTWRGRVR
ncbi:hypothetical protein VDGD_02266 [Verticillium dahliae]|nr:hypothetical protein VDGD_02266 [Verticillium dahliae]